MPDRIQPEAAPVVGSARRMLYIPCRSAVLRGRQAVRGPEGPAEIGRAGETPPGRDRRDRAGGQPRIRQVTAAALQTPPPDPARHGQALVVEELVQQAHRESQATSTLSMSGSAWEISAGVRCTVIGMTSITT